VEGFYFGRLINLLKVSRCLILERYNLVLKVESTASFKKVDGDGEAARLGG
jgi:hypothetical protein